MYIFLTIPKFLLRFCQKGLHFIPTYFVKTSGIPSLNTYLAAPNGRCLNWNPSEETCCLLIWPFTRSQKVIPFHYIPFWFITRLAKQKNIPHLGSYYAFSFGFIIHYTSFHSFWTKWFITYWIQDSASQRDPLQVVLKWTLKSVSIMVKPLGMLRNQSDWTFLKLKMRLERYPRQPDHLWINLNNIYKPIMKQYWI